MIESPYTKLPPNSIVERSVKKDLPIKESDLSVFSYKRTNQENATRIVLQVGYLTDKQLSKLDINAKRVSEGKAIVGILRSIKIQEEILEVSISNVKVPIR